MNKQKLTQMFDVLMRVQTGRERYEAKREIFKEIRDLIKKEISQRDKELGEKLEKEPVELEPHPDGQCIECGKNLCTCNQRMPDGNISKEYGQAWAEIKRKIKALQDLKKQIQ